MPLSNLKAKYDPNINLKYIQILIISHYITPLQIESCKTHQNSLFKEQKGKNDQNKHIYRLKVYAFT